jgi:hypothetical protein
MSLLVLGSIKSFSTETWHLVLLFIFVLTSVLCTTGCLSLPANVKPPRTVFTWSTRSQAFTTLGRNPVFYKSPEFINPKFRLYTFFTKDWPTKRGTTTTIYNNNTNGCKLPMDFPSCLRHDCLSCLKARTLLRASTSSKPGLSFVPPPGLSLYLKARTFLGVQPGYNNISISIRSLFDLYLYSISIRSLSLFDLYSISIWSLCLFDLYSISISIRSLFDLYSISIFDLYSFSLFDLYLISTQLLITWFSFMSHSTSVILCLLHIPHCTRRGVVSVHSYSYSLFYVCLFSNFLFYVCTPTLFVTSFFYVTLSILFGLVQSLYFV